MATLQANGERIGWGDRARGPGKGDFYRGFLDEIALAPDGTLTPARWDAVAANPKLATVRVLRMGAATADLIASSSTADAAEASGRPRIVSLAILRTVLEKPPPKLRRIERMKTSLVERATVRSSSMPASSASRSRSAMVASSPTRRSSLLATERRASFCGDRRAHFEATRPSGIEALDHGRDAFVVKRGAVRRALAP